VLMAQHREGLTRGKVNTRLGGSPLRATVITCIGGVS
jgi:hypothetical protein